jgi:hypothetical protein
MVKNSSGHLILRYKNKNIVLVDEFKKNLCNRLRSEPPLNNKKGGISRIQDINLDIGHHPALSCCTNICD